MCKRNMHVEETSFVDYERFTNEETLKREVDKSRERNNGLRNSCMLKRNSNRKVTVTSMSILNILNHWLIFTYKDYNHIPTRLQTILKYFQRLLKNRFAYNLHLHINTNLLMPLANTCIAPTQSVHPKLYTPQSSIPTSYFYSVVNGMYVTFLSQLSNTLIDVMLNAL